MLIIRTGENTLGEKVLVVVLAASKLIVEVGRNKGLIFHKLYRLGERVFHNCG